jgi:hypothetical protein
MAAIRYASRASHGLAAVRVGVRPVTLTPTGRGGLPKAAAVTPAAAALNLPPHRMDGICNTTDPDAFFPEVGEPTAPARAVCAGCPVRVECLTWALLNDERHGVWGATSPPQRTRLRVEAARTGAGVLEVARAAGLLPALGVEREAA